jgi:hypothetical protein
MHGALVDACGRVMWQQQLTCVFSVPQDASVEDHVASLVAASHVTSMVSVGLK